MPKTAQELGIKAPSGGFQQLGWYPSATGGSFQFKDGTFGESGAIHSGSSQQGAGQRVSNEVIAQTKPANVPYLNLNSQINADRIGQSPNISLPSGSATSDSVGGLQDSVNIARSNLESTLGAKQISINEKLVGLREKEKATLDKVGSLSTPFREELEKTESERLYVNENFEANQALVGELDELLTEGNELIEQQRNVTGLSAVRNPRIQKAMNDVAARSGVIQAVISARNGQIGQAQNMIDRTVRAITSDRNDQITYYETILNLNNRDILSLDEDSKKIAQEQLDLVKGDLTRAQATQDYVKQLMIDPSTAGLMGEAGVSLTDSVETINSKMTQSQYAREVKDMSNEIALEGGQSVISPVGIPAEQLITMTDSRGSTRYYKVPANSKLANGGASVNQVGTIARQIEGASAQDMSYLNLVKTYAGTGMTLGDIREAYDLSSRGKQFGAPNEDPLEIRAIYDVYSGKLSVDEARSQYGIGD